MSHKFWILLIVATIVNVVTMDAPPVVQGGIFGAVALGFYTLGQRDRQ